MRAFYQRGRERFRTQPEVRLSGILLDDPVLADSVRRMLERGEAFESLAARYSAQKGTAARGGDLGWFRQDALGDLGAEVFALRTGDWRGAFVQDGKHLFLMCTGRTPSRYRSFEEASDEIRRILASPAWDDARARCVEESRQRLDCRVFPGRLRSMSFR
jgi:peptidyl-prolyl cis-trans isomerase C